MRITKTEQHLFNTLKKIIKKHFYDFDNIECGSEYKVGDTIFLIRFYEAVGIHGKRDLDVISVLFKDDIKINFDIVVVKVSNYLKDDDIVSYVAKGIKKDAAYTASYFYQLGSASDSSPLLDEFVWNVSNNDGVTTARFLDLRAFFKSYYVVKSVVRINDSINERIIIEVLNNHV